MSAHFGFILTATRARPFWAGVAGALAGTALSLGGALAQDLEGGLAQDSGSMQVGGTTVTVGVGAALLTLPDVPSFVTLQDLTTPKTFIKGFKFSDDFGEEIGWNFNGSVEAPIGANRTVSLNGFWANFDSKDTARCDDGGATTLCAWRPLVDDPAVNQASVSFGGESIDTVAKREVDQWGASLETKWLMNPGVEGVTQAPPRRYLALGADMRGIDQNLDVDVLRIAGGAPTTLDATYTEDLDARYYGAYAAWGGDYSPFLFSSLWNRWGLQSSFRLQGGVYYANTEYDGRFNDLTIANGQNNLKLSDNDVAFIGGLVLETSKRIGRRATLSLKNEYEYYSYVPKMAYNTVDLVPSINNTPFTAGRQDGTSLGNDDAFSFRAMLRFSIKLGPDSIM